jgi:Eukaryotic cytochrome b561
MWDWLMTPLSGSATHTIDAWTYWHARCMVAAWGVLLPVGALAARYFKVLPRQRWPQRLDHKGWWTVHQLTQWSGIALMLVGLALAWGQGSGAHPLAALHAWAGWAVAAVGGLQFIGCATRGSKGGPSEASLRGDHYDMSLRRRAFERLHKTLGWLSLLAAMGVISLGLVVADAPRWMPLALAAWWLLLAAAALRWQRQGRCIDTYQAIWGPDPAHPGNRLPPIGWGVRRPLG